MFSSRAWAARFARGCLLLAVISAGACSSSGIPWRIKLYRDTQQDARRDNKLTFVYFRNWYSVECTDFEERVLKDPEVVAEARKMVCTKLEYDWYEELARSWGLSEVPAFAIIAPDGRVMASAQGLTTRAEVLQAMRHAISAHTPEPAPAPSP